MSFEYIEPTEEQKTVMNAFRTEFKNLAESIKLTTGESRGRALALTKLEEASFWLNKGITHNS